METLACIKKRRSVRNFTKAKIPLSDILKIVDAGRLAPSAANIQGWFFIVVMDEKIKRKIMEACYFQRWIEDASIIIIISANLKIYEERFGKRGKELAIMDISAATENMCLAATDLGYGSCWVANFDKEEVRKILDIPTEVEPFIVLPIGKPKLWPTPPPKKSLEDVTRWDNFERKVPKAPLER